MVQTSPDQTNATLELLNMPVELTAGMFAGIFMQEEYRVSGFRVAATKNGGVTVWTTESGGTLAPNTDFAGPVALNTAHHIAITFAPSLVTIYVDGKAMFSGDP
jgi:hypothetical protein